MLPLRDIVPTRTPPWLSVGLAVGLLAVFLAERFMPTHVLHAFLDAAHPRGRSIMVAPVVAIFLHAGWLQLVSNVACLALFGEAVEDRLGHLRFLVLFCATGIAGQLVHLWLEPSDMALMVGAGGALAGVLGAHLMLFPHSRVLTWIPLPGALRVDEVPAVYFLIGWLVMQLLGPFELSSMTLAGATGTSAVALLGGLVTGLVAARLLRRRDRAVVEWWHP